MKTLQTVTGTWNNDASIALRTFEPRVYALPWYSIASWHYLKRVQDSLIQDSILNSYDEEEGVCICPGIYAMQEESKEKYLPGTLLLRYIIGSELPQDSDKDWKTVDGLNCDLWHTKEHVCPMDWHDKHNMLARGSESILEKQEERRRIEDALASVEKYVRDESRRRIL